MATTDKTSSRETRIAGYVRSLRDLADHAAELVTDGDALTELLEMRPTDGARLMADLENTVNAVALAVAEYEVRAAEAAVTRATAQRRLASLAYWHVEE